MMVTVSPNISKKLFNNMPKPVISVEHLTKKYDLGVIGTGTISRDLNRWWARIRKQPDPYTRIGQRDAFERIGESILALDDVSFMVEQGEALGIIGRNGAGKSTLLKILSRVTAPTSGVVKVKGRIGSLLEVGTGFHPELTGRENVYLNGAILGMKKAEVTRKFDEIVDFAGVEKFIDTPVKRYSSGMYVRLAFAVAAHLESEILIVDEVLAVGDAEFQKKCLGKMGDVTGEGRTVLFVSHNMASISRLCERAIWLNKGGVVEDDKSVKVIHKYLTRDSKTTAEKNWDNSQSAPGNSIAKLKSARIVNLRNQVTETINIDEPFTVEIEYWNLQSQLRPTAIIHFYNDDGICLFASNDWNNLKWRNTPRIPGLVKSKCHIPANFLTEGSINVLVAVNTYNPEINHVLERDIISFQVIDRTEGNGSRGEYVGARWPGVVRPLLHWDIEAE
jgi:lipopolysaccharide transport system ATP-binding protein